MQKSGFHDGVKQYNFNGHVMDKSSGHGQVFPARSNRTEILAKLWERVECSENVQNP